MDSNKKQTAVEWFISKLTEKPIEDINDEYWFGIIGQAKELQKQQHEETSTHMVNYAIHCISNLKESDFEKKFEQYYNETYGGE